VSNEQGELEKDDVAIKILRNRFSRIIKRREEKVITKLVNDYRDGALTEDKAFAAIMAIAELRWAVNDIGTKDLQ